MTRLLCTGDLHIGAGTSYADDRLADQAAVLEQIVDLARDRDADGVLLAGDVFERPKPSPPELHVFDRFVRRLERAAIPTVAILGDVRHDQFAADLPSALELFGRGDWLRVSRHPEILKLGDVSVCTLPAVPVGRIVATIGGRDDVNDLAVAFLLDAAAELRAHVTDGPAVLLAHWAVLGAALPNGLPVSDLHKPMLPMDALEQVGFDAMVFGDIHRPQRLGAAGGSFYVGSPMCLNFGEANDLHGVWLLDLHDAWVLKEIGIGADAAFVPFDSRRFVTVDADLTRGWTTAEYELVDETDVIAAAISEQLPLTDAVVRIRYRCTEEQQRRVDVDALKGFCADAGAHRVCQVAPEIVRATRARVAGLDESVVPGDVLELWAAANAIEDGDRRRARALLDRYLEAVA